MKKIALLILLLLSLAACNEQTQDSSIVQTTAEDSATVENSSTVESKYQSINLEIQDPTVIDGSNWVFYPLGSREANKFSKSSNSGTWNVAFFNTETKQSRLLSDSVKMLIHSISPINKASAKIEPPNNNNGLIFYTISTDDYNQDGKLNYADPRYLFISDLSGQGFKQISPANHNLMHWEIIHRTNKVLIQVRRDSDNNKVFDYEEEIIPFVFDIDSQQLEPVFDPEFNLKTKKLFDTHWVDKK